jgi:hypothetical protein
MSGNHAATCQQKLAADFSSIVIIIVKAATYSVTLQFKAYLHVRFQSAISQ